MKHTTKAILSLFFAAVLAGCGAPKVATPYAIGGSRADAGVEVAYDFSLGTKPPTAYQLSLIARSKCQAWGYDGAEPFGGQNKTCRSESCWDGQVVIQYQCLGNPE